jgi:hypothetical protein
MEKPTGSEPSATTDGYLPSCKTCRHYLTPDDESDPEGFCVNELVPPNPGKFGILKSRKDTDSCEVFEQGQPELF